MTTDVTRTAPYAPLSNVLVVIRRLRERGLPETLTPQELARIGVPDGNAARTLQALRLLGLADEEGRRSPRFDRLGRATSTEYPDVLAEIIKDAYAPVLTIIDPATAGEHEIHDAFRSFEPRAQRGRMVSLFIGLCREAALRPGGPVERVVRTKRQERIREVLSRASRERGPVIPPPQNDGMVTFDLAADTNANGSDQARPDYRLLVALIQQLPRDGKWTEARRDRWINAMTVNLDLLVEIDDDPDR